MNDNDLCCILCNLNLKSVFIACVDCSLDKSYICLECFSQGLENSVHKSDHGYKVLNLNRIKTFSNWTISEELNLIESFSDLNSQNWARISAGLQEKSAVDGLSARRSAQECKIHFDQWLNILNEGKRLENFEMSSDIELYLADNSFIMRENDLNPPRPTVHSYQYRRMSGYRAARGDFETEFNDTFEMKYISDIDYYEEDEAGEKNGEGEDTMNKTENDQFVETIKLSVVETYRDLIRERYSMKKFIRDFGLLNDLAVNSMHSQSTTGAPKMLNHQQQQQHNLLPLKFYRLFDSSQKLTEYIELVNYQADLKKRLDELYEYQKSGIKRFRHVELFKKLKTMRENRNKSSYLSSLLTTVIRHDIKDKKLNGHNCKEWLKRFLIEENLVEATTVQNTTQSDSSASTAAPSAPTQTTTSASMISQQKYKNNPLKIENYPEADKLNDDEKEFCRVSRIQPIVYLRVKQILVLEYNKAGFVTYSRARKIASIDVNKTRKIHNFLLHLNLIKASNDVS